MYPLAYVSIICAYSNTYVLVMLAVLSKLCTITYSNIHTHTALYSHHNTVKKPLIAWLSSQRKFLLIQTFFVSHHQKKRAFTTDVISSKQHLWLDLPFLLVIRPKPANTLAGVLFTNNWINAFLSDSLA